MFTDFFYLLRKRGLKVSFDEWLMLLEALDKGLAYASLTEFYWLARAVLIKTEADYDKFDMAFAEYFRGVEPTKTLPPEVMEWLSKTQAPGEIDKDEVDARTTLDLEKLRQMFEERLKEQNETHNGGKYWIGTGGTSVMGNGGYAASGIRVGGEGKHRTALQVATEREFKDFRDDKVLEMRQFQLAFRRLRQFSVKTDGPKDVLDLDGTIRATCDKAGQLQLVFTRPRENGVKLMLLFDSGGSMWPYAKLCSQLFQAVAKSNHFRDLQVYYFHNCFYQRLYTTPNCVRAQSVDTYRVLNNLSSEYKVIIVGDAAMAPSELLMAGGGSWYYEYNEEPGIDWIHRFTAKYEKMVWFNPLEKNSWAYRRGSTTIDMIAKEIPMYPLTVGGLEQGLKKLIGAR